jgi:hypothetical protein
VPLEGLDRVGVQRDGPCASVGLGVVLVHLPAVDNELLGDGDEPGVQVGVGPLLPARLAPAQPAEGDQVEQRVQAVLRDVVEEEAGVLRCPDHDRRGLLAGALPVKDALLGPHQGLGPLARLQLDVGGRVEGDQLLGDRGVQRGPQRGADALTRGRTDDAPIGLHLDDGRLHRLVAGAVLALYQPLFTALSRRLGIPHRVET